ncbi:MAG: transcriptional repressor [Bdellovibrionota bacterium]
MERTALPLLPRQSDDDIKVFESDYGDDDFKLIIRKLNLKVTHQRLAILKCMHEGRRHVTAQELYEKVNKLNPEIGFATVYRFLRSLAENQMVTEVRMGGLPARYELTPKSHHDHLTCIKCNKICEFENNAIERLQEKVAVQFGFILTHHVLELYGVCPHCQNESDGRDRHTRSTRT